MRLRIAIALALAAPALGAAPAGASTGPLPTADLVISAHGVSGMRHAHRSVFATLSPGKWAEELTETEKEFDEYNKELFEHSFEQGVITSLEGRREGRGRREVVGWVEVFGDPESALQETSENAQGTNFKGTAAFAVPLIPGATGSGTSRGKKGGFANIAFAAGRCAAVVGDSVHRHAPGSLAAQPATAAAVALYRRLVPICS
jgi:hypothetical protein